MLPFGTTGRLAKSLLWALQLATAVQATRPTTGGGRHHGGVGDTLGHPIVGDYAGRYRPQVHYSPPQYFMNDPNGLFRDANGTWHLYYQYNPTGIVAGNQHWGHATSLDLYHWTNQPVALKPPRKNVFVFSGSAVVDVNNTSGFFPNQSNGVVAIYTLSETHDDGTPGPQTQAVSISHDGGYHFLPYQHNPVIASNSSQFRDPKVVWYNNHWVMLVAYSVDYVVGIYTSPNLIDWTHASNFSGHGLLGLQWECPNLVRMPYVNDQGQKVDSVWLLTLSINPGAALGGSATIYYPGMFNGTHFEPVDSIARTADFAKDNYAGQFFYGQLEDEDPVFIAWASNWQYAQVSPTDQDGWRSTMSLPRQTFLTKEDRVGWKMGSLPYDLSPVLGETLNYCDSLVNRTTVVDFSKVSSNAVYWEANVTGIPQMGIPASATLNFTFTSPSTGEFIRGGYYFGGDKPFFLDRAGVKGFDNAFFTDKFSTNILPSNGKFTMSGVLDRSIIEVFLNGGVDSATSIFYPMQPLTLLTISSADLPDGMAISVRVSALKSAWGAMTSNDGLVHGNWSGHDGGHGGRGGRGGRGGHDGPGLRLD
ncbi:hypothetical protein E4U41_000012 [Claviceps citrina]|nr:hypothetical protein E4U41_000012 [Claviceps citrina]